ncbi:MAG: hypothetical protein CVV64_04180 [Candidatus Wallbacteria bacterium HGW-Wallbacteria-1]|jgi:hypothetical protein|uniref:Uncharacterized protein n=1 Tax=Candidatus Wallbacteria bacterium HGW-Wallbacteria-1 TaxID=2013854 RepID=A0A2N1PRK6_9BACT|nr:MAG: hypothetical protein CVV64_04180 [Candidatus Wallbacteria bacterium HGW-Wallbacteria-1]
MKSNRVMMLSRTRLNNQNQSGIAIFVVLGIVGVLSVLGIFASKFSSSQKYQVVKSIADSQADYLLNAATEIAMVTAAKSANGGNYSSLSTSEKQASSLYYFGKPSQKQTAASNGDFELNYPSGSALQYTDAQINLASLANQIGAEVTNLSVSMEMDKAYSVGSSAGHQTVGVDTNPWMRGLTSKYVNEGTITPWVISMPTFSLVDLCTINLADVFEAIVGIPIPSEIGDKCKVNIGKMFQTATGIQLPVIKFSDIFQFFFPGMPSEFTIDLPALPLEQWSDQWPGISAPSGSGYNVRPDFTSEKYGLVKVATEMHFKSDRRIEFDRVMNAKIEFKVSDVQPVAPLYSFFIRNSNNDLNAEVFRETTNPITNLSGVGRRLFVNSMPSSFLGNVVGGIFGSGTLPPEPEFPGLVRVNGPSEYLVNASWFNMPRPLYNLPTAFREHSTLMIDYAKVPFTFKSTSVLITLGVAIAGVIKTAIEAAADPDVTIGQALLSKADDIIADSASNNWVWPPGALPYGIPVLPIFLPNPFDRGNTTFLFGEYSLSPTLWREIEGNVKLVKYQWCFWIFKGLLLAADQFLGFCPIPIPLVWTRVLKEDYTYSSQGIVKTIKNDIFNPPSGFTQNSGNTPFAPAKEGGVSYGATGPLNVQTDSTLDVPNLYDEEQYAKKCTRYYADVTAFETDFPNLLDTDGYFDCSGVIFIDCPSSSVSGLVLNFPPTSFSGDLKVKGKGIVVTPAALQITTNVIQGEWEAGLKKPLDTPANQALRAGTTLSLVSLAGPVKLQGTDNQVVEASIYGEEGIVCTARYPKIYGNLVVNKLDKALIAWEVVVNYRSSRTRTSLFSTRTDYGKFDPNRLHLAFGMKSETRYGRK